MESSSSRNDAKRMEQAEIKRQIAELQRKLEHQQPTRAAKAGSPKRRAPEEVTLAPATPSPKKKRKLDHVGGKPLNRPVFHIAPQQNAARPSALVSSKAKNEEKFKTIAPSTMLGKLASLNRPEEEDDSERTIARSTGFTERPAEIQQESELLAHKRDERLALIENLEPGPYEHTLLQDDPNFEKLEPHSGINLSSRTIPHDEFNAFFTDRYYLSPSRLYSAIRLLPDKQGYDVPVAGDWITIAVVAERGPIKFTRAPVKIEREAGELTEAQRKWKGKAKEEPESKGKKFVNIRLIDFGARSGTSATTKAVIRGDAFLSLLLFEADGVEYMDKKDGKKPQKVYRGGSKGAFENLTNLREGDVIAMLNPKILKPFQRSADTPHPVNNVLAVTPEAASSIIVVGRCRDLGMCQVIKQDGKVCGSWCDKRVSEVCDYHVQSAVQRRRAARPEFSVGTGGMSNASTHKRKHDYDPRKQWGLKPEERTAGGSATYVISGHVVSGSAGDARTLYEAESIGREGQAKARRRMAKDSDDALKRLLERDKDGMKAVMMARKAGKLVNVGAKKGDKGKARKAVAEEPVAEEEEERPKTVYSASIIKSLGFDPGMKPGQRRADHDATRNKLEALEALLISRKDPDLGPPPGPKVRSGVRAPIQRKDDTPKPKSTASTQEAGDNDMEHLYYLDDSDGENFPDTVAIDKTAAQKPAEKMVDLDDF